MNPFFRRIEAKTIELVGAASNSDDLARRAHRVIDRFDRIGITMQKVADLQLEVMTRLRPIVDDLGELVKLSLLETRRRVEGTDQAGARVNRSTSPLSGSDSVDSEANSKDRPEG